MQTINQMIIVDLVTIKKLQEDLSRLNSFILNVDAEGRSNPSNHPSIHPIQPWSLLTVETLRHFLWIHTVCTEGRFDELKRSLRDVRIHQLQTYVTVTQKQLFPLCHLTSVSVVLSVVFKMRHLPKTISYSVSLDDETKFNFNLKYYPNS